MSENCGHNVGTPVGKSVGVPVGMKGEMVWGGVKGELSVLIQVNFICQRASLLTILTENR